VPYVFFVNEKEIKGTLEAVLEKEKINTEHVVDIVYQQQAVFRVRPVTRCTRWVNKTYFYSDTRGG
jgi:ribosome assembly protein 4